MVTLLSHAFMRTESEVWQKTSGKYIDRYTFSIGYMCVFINNM